jgi:hypothetical protein
MEVKVVFYSVLSPYMDGKVPSHEEVWLSITDTTTLKELFDSANNFTADKSITH